MEARSMAADVLAHPAVQQMIHGILTAPDGVTVTLSPQQFKELTDHEDWWLIVPTILSIIVASAVACFTWALAISTQELAKETTKIEAQKIKRQREGAISVIKIIVYNCNNMLETVYRDLQAVPIDTFEQTIKPLRAALENIEIMSCLQSVEYTMLNTFYLAYNFLAGAVRRILRTALASGKWGSLEIRRFFMSAVFDGRVELTCWLIHRDQRSPRAQGLQTIPPPG